MVKCARGHSSLSNDCHCSDSSICCPHLRYFTAEYNRLALRWPQLGVRSLTCDGRVVGPEKRYVGEFDAGVAPDSVSHLNELPTYAKSSLLVGRSRMKNGRRCPSHLSWPRWLMLAT
jgi:hypothetical protein